MQVNALVLAGGKIKDFEEGGYKAFLPIGNSKMLDYVINALKESSLVSKIAVTSVPRDQDLSSNGFEIIPPKRDLISSIANALEGLPEKKTLLVASDIPLLTSEMIDNFIEECEKYDDDFYYPLIPKDSVMKTFPTTKRTYFTLTEGIFTGGNIFMVTNETFLKNQELAKKVYADRKKPHKIAMILGLKFLYRFFRKTLTLADAEQKVSEIIGGKAKAIVFPFPEVGTDVDKKSDYDLVKVLLADERN